jgi:hypothetical protein
MLHSDYTVVALLLHCCDTVITLLPYYCYTVVTLLHVKRWDLVLIGVLELGVGHTHDTTAFAIQIVAQLLLPHPVIQALHLRLVAKVSVWCKYSIESGVCITMSVWCGYRTSITLV